MKETNYWAIAARDLEILNPITDRKLRLLDDYCEIGDGQSVLDIGCGKGWLLRQWAGRYALRGAGIETNPAFVSFARERAIAEGQARRLSFNSVPPRDFEVEPGSFDVALCLGATEALGGFVAAVEWMVRAVRPGGCIVVGEPTLKHRPPIQLNEILPHDAVETIALIERHGAEVSATISASDADFERYVSHHRQATLAWGRAHPEHPDHAEVLRRSRADWDHYLRVVRPYFGWTAFVGRRND